MVPWPSSTLPILRMTVLSALTVIQELSIGLRRRFPGSSEGSPAAAATRGSEGARAKARVSEPLAWTKPRRDVLILSSMTQAPSAARRTARMIRAWVPQRQRLSLSAVLTSDSAGFGFRSRSACAAMIIPGMQIAALHRLLFDKGLLQRACAPVRVERFERLDRAAGRGGRLRLAGGHGLAVDQHRACAALGQTAAILGPGNPCVMRQHLKQGRSVWHVYVDISSIQIECNHWRFPPIRPGFIVLGRSGR